MVRLAWLLACAVFGAAAHAEPLPETDQTRADFASKFIEILKDAGEKRAMRYEPDGFKVLIGDDIAFLANRWDEYRAAAPADRPAVLARFRQTRGFRPPPDTWAEARKALLPVVRHRGYYDAARRMAVGREDNKPPFTPLGEHLGFHLVYDLEGGRIDIPARLLTKWGVSWKEARDVALANLAALGTESFAQPPSMQHWESPWRDNYDAARLLIGDLLGRVTVRGDLIALPVNRDTLLLAGSDEVLALEILAREAERGFDQPRQITAWPLRLNEGTWTSWLPPPGHKLHRRFRELKERWLQKCHEEQVPDLKRELEARKETLHVATYQVYRDPQQEFLTLCTWSDGVPSLLPRTDLVGLPGLKDPKLPLTDENMVVHATVRWNDLVRIAGARMKQTADWPERWRVDSFPDAKELEQLRAVDMKLLK